MKSLPAAKVEHITSLTGLRFFAAAMIVEGHSWQLFEPSFVLGLKLNHGVSIFFILSGFILACSYPTLSEVRSRRFFLARLARIWPLHMLTTALLIVMLPSVINELFKAGGLLTAIQYVTLTHAWFPTMQNILAYNGVSWSISAEALFYATFPLWIMDWGRLTPLKLPVAIMPALFLMQYANLAGIPLGAEGSGVTAMSLLYFFPAARLPEFVMGVLLGQLWYRRRYQFSSMTSDVTTVIVLALTVVALAYTWPIAHHPTTQALLGPVGYVWFLESGFTPVYALLIFVLASSTGRISRVLGSRPLVLLGEISFGMYLIHTIFLRFMGDFKSVIAQDPHFWRLAYWAAVIATSYIAFAYFETPVRKAITGRKRLTTEETTMAPAALR